MPRRKGNESLKAARIAAGYGSQQALADALQQLAAQPGMPGGQISVRQVSRWESVSPPWPRPDHCHLLTQLLGRSMSELGFSSPHGDTEDTSGGRNRRALLGGVAAAVGLDAAPSPAPGAASQPASIGADFEAITVAHRRMYWSLAPARLHQTVLVHAELGYSLLAETTGTARRRLAAALAESYLQVGRIRFFDLREPDAAGDAFVRAFQAAGEADDALLGAAVLAHTAFIPGWSDDMDTATERMTAARAYARRGQAPPLMLAWLDAVEAECATRCGDPHTALQLISHGEDTIANSEPAALPAWLDWFTPVRLAAFKGNTQLVADHLPQARQTLQTVLADMPETDGKQKVVVLGDLAAVEVKAGNPEQACQHVTQALDQLARTWYGAGMERLRDVRRQLQPWRNESYVRELDDRLYSWTATISTLRG